MKEMKLNFFKTIIFSLILFLSLGNIALAQEEIESPNYKIVSPTLTSGGEISSATNYSFYSSLGEIADPKLSSPSYAATSGTPSGFIAKVPLITCFETNTNSGSSTCNSSYPNQDGTRGEAGEGGYFDRAKFVIDAQNNPTDTLYGIQISDDNFTTIEYIDGLTRQAVSTKNISNFLTKSAWEDSPWNGANIIGLDTNTTYKIRITALSGDLTESYVSPEAQATTGETSITFDIDIGTSNWPNAEESSSPYSLTLGNLPAGSIVTATNRIYMDAGTNLVNGMRISATDLYTGLFSSSASATIPSPSSGNPASIDLATVSTGFGLRISNVNTTTPSSLTRSSSYYDAGIAQLIGRVRASGSDILMTTSTGISTGRAQIEVKTKASSSTPVGTDYSDTITFTASSNP